MNFRAYDVLQHLYFYCKTLIDTIATLNPNCELIRNDDNDSYTYFCRTTIVAARTTPGGYFNTIQTRSQLEILHSVVENICKNSSVNALSLGYQQLRHNKGLLVAGTKNIESYYPNTVATYVNGQLWQKLLSRIGDDMMIFLLQSCSLYMKLDQGCLLQVTGPPIGNLFTTASIPFLSKQKFYSTLFHSKQRKQTKSTGKNDDCVPSVKRYKPETVDNHESTTSHIRSSDVQSNPLEVSELYLTADESPEENDVVDKPPVRLSHDQPSKRGMKRSNDYIQMVSKKRLKLSYSNLLKIPRERKSAKKGKGWRSNGKVKDIFIHRSGLFYTQCQRECFPDSGHVLNIVRSSKRGGKNLIVDIFRTARLNSDWIKFQQQHASLANVNKGFYEKSPSGELTGYNTFDILVGCYTGHSQIGDFVISVVDQVIPDVLWGSKSNRNTFYHHIRRFIKLGRYERFSLKQILHKMKPSQCGWLKIKTSGRSGWRQVTDSNKQKQLFSEWLLWLMDELVVKLLKGYFYITESSNHCNKVFYYRKPVWKRIQQLSLKDITKTMLTRISQDKVKEIVELKQTVGVAKLWLLPRVGGVRLIANMGSRLNLPFVQVTTTGKQEHSKLQNVFHVLTYEKMSHPEELGHSAFGPNDIYNTLLPFVQRLQQENRTESLFFISVDISCCYDSIILSKICDIIKKIIQEDEYTIRRYVTVMVSRNRIRRHYKRTATIPGDTVSFPEFANDLVSNCSLRNAIISDQVVYPFEEKEAILATLKKHILQNIVKFGGNYYRQVQGISQGSILSALFCKLCFTAFVKTLRRKQSTHLPLLYMITKALRRTSYLLSPSEELRFTEVVKNHNFDFVVY